MMLITPPIAMLPLQAGGAAARITSMRSTEFLGMVLQLMVRK